MVRISVISAWAGGMKRVDLSLSLCPHCDTSASDQVSDLVNYIRFYGDKLKYSVIWFDMENGMYVWNDQDFNRYMDPRLDACAFQLPQS
jgi:hypothetical protein